MSPQRRRSADGRGASDHRRSPARGGGRLRLSSGEFRGRLLRVGKGLRPTEGRVREALFSIWRPALEGCRFLDLFAGSGALALEAEGLGALEVLAVDHRTEDLIHNLDRVGSRAVKALQGSLPEILAQAPAERFDRVFADPPYEFSDYPGLIAAVEPWLAKDGEAAFEHSRRRDLPAAVAGLLRVDRRHYGETSLSFYRHGPAT
ncbi:MAG: RsmD family RNA methyltransferase [Acidobacteriota bacterium]